MAYRNSFLVYFLYVNFVKCDEICINNVQYHRGSNYLPATGPFCLVRQTKQDSLKEIEILTTTERFEELGLMVNDSNVETETVKLRASIDSEERPFVIPSITLDEVCSGSQELEIGRNITFTCNRLLAECDSNSFLSIDHLSEQSHLLKTKFADFNTRKPVWRNGTCEHAIKEIKLVFVVNNTEIIDCIVTALEFIDAKDSFEQSYSIQFIKHVLNRTDNRGYEYGGHISTNKIDRILSLPSVGYCSLENATPISFLHNLSTGCFIRARSCSEAQSSIKLIYDSFSSDFILSEPSEDARRVPYLRANLTFPTVTSEHLCSIVSSYKLRIAYARQGFEHDFYLLIVAFASNHKLSTVPFTANQSIPVPFHITFHDITQTPQSTFAALPHINLRLPSDFFFPFVSSKTFSCHSFSSFFVLLYYFAYS